MKINNLFCLNFSSDEEVTKMVMLSDLSENDSKMSHIEEGGKMAHIKQGGKKTNKSTTSRNSTQPSIITGKAVQLITSRNSTHPSITTGKAAQLVARKKNHIH